MKKSAIVLFCGVLMAVSAFAQNVQDGITNLYAERTASAKAVFEKMLAANPNNLEATYWLGQTYLADDNVAGAKALYEKALAANGNAPLVLVGMGHVELLEGKTAEARQRFESAISLSRGKKGDDPIVLNAIGRANVDAKAGDVAYAVAKLTQASQLAPNNADIFLNLGNAYRKQQNGGQAVTNYMKAKQINPKYAIASYRTAKLYQTQNNWEIVNENLNNAIAADPKFAPAYYELYYYNLQNKKFTEAEQFASQYIANSDPSVENDYIKASTAYVQGKYDDAIGVAKNILSATNNNAKPVVYRLLAYSYLDKQDTANAKQYIDQFFAKAKEEDIVGNDLILKANIYAKDDPSVVASSYLAAAKMDSVLANQLKFLTQGIERFKASGQKVMEGSLRLAAYELKPTKNPAELFSVGLPFYQGGDYKRADSLFNAYAIALPDSIYGHYWSALARAQMDSTMSQGLAIPAYEKTLQIASTDKVRYKSQGFASAGYLAGYYNNVKSDKAQAIAYLQKALEFDPTNTGIQRNLQILQKAPAPAAPAKSKTPPTTPSKVKTSAKGTVKVKKG